MHARQLVVAIDAEHERRALLRRAEQVAHEQQRGLVGPLQVVEHERHRLDARDARHEHGHRLEQAVALRLGLALQRRGEVGHTLGEQRDEPGELTAETLELRAQRGVRRRRDVVVERLDERLVRHQHLLVAPAVEHGRAVGVQPAGQLTRELGLADAGLTRHEQRPTSTGARVRPRLEEPLELGVAAHEHAARRQRQRGWQREVHGTGTGSAGAGPDPRLAGGHDDRDRAPQLEDVLVARQAPELVLAEVDELGAVDEPVAHQLGGCVGDEHLPAGGERPDPGGPVQGRAVVVAVALERLARVDRDPHPQAEPGRPRLGQDPGADVEGGEHGVARPREDGEGGVALALGLDQAAVGPVDHLADELVVAGERVRHRVGLGLPQRRRALDVGEEERHDAGRQVPAHCHESKR